MPRRSASARRRPSLDALPELGAQRASSARRAPASTCSASPPPSRRRSPRPRPRRYSPRRRLRLLQRFRPRGRPRLWTPGAPRFGAATLAARDSAAGPRLRSSARFSASRARVPRRRHPLRPRARADCALSGRRARRGRVAERAPAKRASARRVVQRSQPPPPRRCVARCRALARGSARSARRARRRGRWRARRLPPPTVSETCSVFGVHVVPASRVQPARARGWCTPGRWLEAGDSVMLIRCRSRWSRWLEHGGDDGGPSPRGSPPSARR